MENPIEIKKSGFRLTWNQLKWIAIVSMIIDHTSKVLLPQIFYIEQLGMDMKTSYMIYHLLPAVGRIAFPIFAFGIAQGCRFTRNPKHYILRLALFAVISEVPYNLAMNSTVFKFRIFAFHNVFFTLLFGALCCYIYAFFRSKNMAWVSFVPILCVILLAELLGMDYGGFGMLFILMPYIFHKNKITQLIALGVVIAVFYMLYTQFTGFGQPYPFIWMDPLGRSVYQFTDTIGALIGVALLAFYGGEKGKGYHKWLFYVIYPVHLLLLYLLRLVFPA